MNPEEEPIEIEGTESYLVGGHAQAGYWINTKRETTIPGLYAAGDVAGGVPYKFVSGCWAEGIIAAENAVKYLKQEISSNEKIELVKDFLRNNMNKINLEKNRIYAPIKFNEGISSHQMEARLQKIMDNYAGEVSRYYEMNEPELNIALKKVRELKSQIKYLIAENYHQLMNCHEIIDRIEIAEVLIHHLLYRKETRWPGYQTRNDYPEKNDDKWLKFVNSFRKNNQINIIERSYEKII